MKPIEICAVWHSGDYRPNFALGAAWDQATHYFTDYLCKERKTYALPDGYELGQDMMDGYHIYKAGSCRPCELGRVKHGGDWLPHIFDGDGTGGATLLPIEEAEE